jgi:beta-lactamase class A
MKIKTALLAFMLAAMAASCMQVATPELVQPTAAMPTDHPPATSTSPSTLTNVPSPTCTRIPSYNDSFLKALGTDGLQCLPDKTRQGIGIYVYNLDSDQALVSINPDVPFQFASAFKGPVLVYFLKSCKKYWDTTSPEWNGYFKDMNGAKNIEWYTSEEYKNKLVTYLSDVTNWETIESFSATNRASVNGETGLEDQRYLILAQVHNMVTQSDNVAAGLVLNFVYENCLVDQSIDPIEQECGSSNAITEFNQWFDEFSRIEYEDGEQRRGLYNFDVVTNIDENGKSYDIRMPTYGLVDNCAIQNAFKDCSSVFPPQKAWTARDLFKFYYSLFHVEDETVKAAGMGILKIDEPGNSRGYLKNMARKMNAKVMSKNGISGAVLADAGIMEYKGHFYVISTLSYNAVSPMIALYGQYNTSGDPVGDEKGLLQELIESSLLPR